MPKPPLRWPVAPRPFPDEALGSWLGRVAALYRIKVSTLAASASFDLGPNGHVWLAPCNLSVETILRLATLATLPVASIQAMADSVPRQPNRHYRFCFSCLVLNPVDVTAPYWKAHWLATEERICGVHGIAEETIGGSAIAAAGNMPRLINAISKRRRDRQRWRRAIP